MCFKKYNQFLVMIRLPFHRIRHLSLEKKEKESYCKIFECFRRFECADLKGGTVFHDESNREWLFVHFVCDLEMSTLSNR